MRQLIPFCLVALACNTPPVDPQVGSALATKFKCASCHGSDLSGSESPIAGSFAYAGNLTPDPTTGLGNWTDDQILADIRNDACTVMPAFALSDVEGSALVGYLRSLLPVMHQIPMSNCAGPAPTDLDDASLDDTGVLVITNP
jgi:mono/diheme cytochrome c family protein